MTTIRLLLLSMRVDEPSRCLHVDDVGRILGRATLLPGTADPSDVAPSAARTIVALPGADVRMLWLPLRAHSPAQAIAAARAQLTDQLAGDRDTVHVAVANQTDDDRQLVAVVDTATLRGWQARVIALGLQADVMVPESLLIAATDSDSVDVVDRGDRWIVRGPEIALSAEPELAGRMLAGRACRHLSAIDADAAMARGAGDPAIDLLQGDFARAAPRPSGILAPRRVAWLVAALVASPLLLLGAQALRYQMAAQRLDAQTAALAASAIPSDQANSADPAGALRGALLGLQAPGRLTSAMRGLSSALARSPGTLLVDFTFSADSGVHATVRHQSAAQLDAIRATLLSDGWRSDAGGTQATDNGLETALTLTTLEPKA